MILRIVLGRFAAGTEAATLVTLRDQLTRAARTVNGLESLILGVRAADELEAASAAAATEPAPGPDGAVVSVWRDVESMSRATGDVTTDRLISTRFQLPMRTTATHHFELVDRAFGALPPDAVALLRIVTIRARINEEARLLEILRARQPRMIDRGLVGTQLARRVVAGGEVEAAVTALWPDRSSVIQAAGRPELTALPDPDDLLDWQDRLTIDAFDAIEIAPRLPPPSGPPLFIIDGELRIVDLTATAAAMLGMPAVEMVGTLVEERSLLDEDARRTAWSRLLEEGVAEGETAWRVPDTGAVQLRFVARRDVPIPGRHAVLVRRRLEPRPTLEELDAAVEEAFGSSADPDR
jgi:PAS domain-containing protein